MKNILLENIDAVLEKADAVRKYLYENPETGKNEYLACEYLGGLLEGAGFVVEKAVCGYPTAFRAVFDSGRTGRTVAYMCEYDALRNIGHGCGHNLIAAMSIGAAIMLKEVLDETGGRIIVFGTPAEETEGAKVVMANSGEFAAVDAAMIIHPESYTHQSGESLAMDSLEFRFFGKSAHAAAGPENGVNALDAVMLMFHGVNCLRQHVTSDVRIHGVVRDGGTAPNIVPEYSSCHYYVRAKQREYLDTVVEKVKNCACGAALMTGTRTECFNNEPSYDNMITNSALSECFSKNLLATGENEILPQRDSYGSIDMGNVSRKCPSIHPYLSITDYHVTGHSREFADATMTERAKVALKRGIIALCCTGYDIITDDKLAAEVRKEFENIANIQR